MKKICLVCDIPNWAFDIIAHKLKEELKSEYMIDIKYFDVREMADNFFEFLEENKNYDLIHFFWRKTLLQFETEIFKNKVSQKYDLQEYLNDVCAKISTGVYDFLFLKDDEIKIFEDVFNKYSLNYYVTSKRMLEKYNLISTYKKPWGVVHDICDTSKMTPINLERFDDFKRSLTIGWVGNSKARFEDIDLKGFNTILKPMVSELINQGYDVKEYYADRNEKWRTVDEMPEYYSQIDVCVCASIMEGTPLPVLEAMSCGVPIISTDVGVVSEALGKKQKEFIIGDREYGKNDEEIRAKLKEKLIYLCKNRDVLRELSAENLNSINIYDGGKILNEYRKYFASLLQ